jgi:DNA/RNA-binding domain of Phe-tRNA-synthetase-like protein
MMQVIIDAAVRQNFELSLGIAELRSVLQREENALDTEIAAVEAELRSVYRLAAVKDIGTLRKQRDFFWQLDVDPTKVRPASEALLRRIVQGKSLPRISPIVDAYNLASVKTLLTFSAFDAAKIELPLCVRFAQQDEEVLLIGPRMKRLSGRELVLTDAARILCVYVHGDADATKVTDATRDVLLVAYGIPGVSDTELEEGLSVAVRYILRFAGGELLGEAIYR